MRNLGRHYDTGKALIRMSWHPQNLYNLAQRVRAPDLSRHTVYQKRWAAKKELRAYHVPHITEKQMLNRHTPLRLPNRQMTAAERERMPPLQSAAFAELERRVDVVVFRSHFASSLTHARRLVQMGQVTVNGHVTRFPAQRLEDGDMLGVNPASVPTLAKTVAAPNAARDFVPVPFMAPWMFTPDYLEVDYPTCTTVLLRSPLPQSGRMEIPSPLPPTFHQYAYQWYISKRRRQTYARNPPRIVVSAQHLHLKPKVAFRWRQTQDKLREKKLLAWTHRTVAAAHDNAEGPTSTRTSTSS